MKNINLPLSIEDRLRVLKEAKRIIEETSIKSLYKIGLCIVIKQALEDLFSLDALDFRRIIKENKCISIYLHIQLQLFIPEFSKEEAIKNFHANEDLTAFWWSELDKTRLKYLDHLINKITLL